MCEHPDVKKLVFLNAKNSGSKFTICDKCGTVFIDNETATAHKLRQRLHDIYTEYAEEIYRQMDILIKDKTGWKL